MRAMVLQRQGEPLQPAELSDPDVGGGQVLISVAACAVCRTDLHILDGELPRPKLPLVPGHQIVGTVLASGEGAERFAVGDRIGVPWLGWTDGVCRYCTSGRENLCDRARFVGYEADGGYARELTADEQERQQRELAGRVADYDVVVTTALVPGRPAPRLIPAAAVEAMRPGSVIVDLAAEAGGNCELTEPGDEIEHGGVTVVGFTNLPSTMPFHASQLYARNVSALLQHLAPEGELVLDWDDEITSGACVTRAKAAV